MTTLAEPASARPFPPAAIPEPPARPLAHVKAPTLLFRTSSGVGKHVAETVAALIRERHAAGRATVLGLPTGSTPVGVYRELIRLHREDGLDFSRVITFNLDEYWPMQPDSLQSYRRWMRENFFDHVNVPPENIHIPRGDVPRHAVDDFCREYEAAIAAAGGIDIQMLGIGRTGHIGFNEPGSARDSRTRLVNLDPVTRRDASSDFFGEEHVPHRAVTMGVGTILSARKVIVMALGEHKARVVERALEGPETPDIVASFLQSHPSAEFVLDAAAAAELTAVKTPWIIERVDWTPHLERRAVIWLSQQRHKPILKLEARDFQEHHLSDLVHESGPVARIRQRVFDDLHATLCPHPGGTVPQRVLVFSPHPDDDVISMGGTLITLCDQGHEAHVAYMTSGNIAVFDHDARRHVEFMSEFLEMFGLQTPASVLLEQRIRQSMASKRSGDCDAPEVLKIKSLIRKTEAVAAAIVAGVPAERCHFLDLPFYQTGQVEKKPISQADVDIIVRLLLERQPAQVYLAGDLSDPHGTHRMCAKAILGALASVAGDGLTPEVWLYRGAWQEYEPHEIERAVPLSPETMLRKKLAIFRHESQKDAALFPGHDEREFWVRADERTRHTARLYNEMGLPEFVALEAFRRYDGWL
ncbi:MAG: glucosamine-6-phosphate deaminase [Planctomyces sp.]|nr:glucosamine-6-phosphate deaminase [Planctomyces sp.]